MLQSIAEVVEITPVTARRLFQNIQVLSRYQEELARKMLSTRLRHVKRGSPASVWLSMEIVRGKK
jgi:hypothetical protein